jgi:hypothetical protein
MDGQRYGGTRRSAGDFPPYSACEGITCAVRLPASPRGSLDTRGKWLRL